MENLIMGWYYHSVIHYKSCSYNGALKAPFLIRRITVNIFKRMEETKDLILSMRKRVSNVEDISKEAMDIVYDFSTLYAKLQVWFDNGAKTFRLSKELIDAFTLTDVPLDIKPSDFKFPFNTFLIEGEKPLYYIDISENKKVDVHALLFVDRAIVDADAGTLIITKNGEVRDTVEWDVSISGLSPGFNNYGLDHMWVNLRNNETIEDACKIASRKNREVVTISEAQRAVNIFFNTIMYINDSTRLPVETESRHSVKYKLNGKKSAVKSDFILLKPPRRYISVYSNKTGRTIDKRWIVRGHWANQAYGKGHLLRKRIWILPYWKGPELSEIVSKKYKVR